MDYQVAQQLGPAGQLEYLEKLLEEKWCVKALRISRPAARTPSGWGQEYSLARDSMNPVMTAKFMREGRLPHRSPDLRGLYLAAAHAPGQWVSFCAISEFWPPIARARIYPDVRDRDGDACWAQGARRAHRSRAGRNSPAWIPGQFADLVDLARVSRCDSKCSRLIGREWVAAKRGPAERHRSTWRGACSP